jgi:hypothetical protein
MHDTGGMVEQINPGKLSRITIEPVEAPLLPGEAVEVKSNAPLNGSSSKRGLRKKK